jgi:hypothetical protein
MKTSGNDLLLNQGISASILCTLLVALIPMAALGQAAVPIQPAGPTGDTIVTQDGKSLTGKIVSMGEGKISYIGASGVTSVSLEEVKSFQIHADESGTVDPQAIQRILANQSQIVQQLNSLAQSLAYLEQRLLNVQSNQAVQSRRIIERTAEINPMARVVPLNYNIGRNSKGTAVTGQVMNQSESAVSNLQVQVTVFGSTGHLDTKGGQITQVGSVMPTVLGPGQIGMYEVSFNRTLAVQDVQVNVIGYPALGGIPQQAYPGTFGEY